MLCRRVRQAVAALGLLAGTGQPMVAHAQTAPVQPPIRVPVLQLNFYPPDRDRPEYLDFTETGWKDTRIDTMQAATRGMVEAMLPMINDATRYHGNRDANAPRFLEYYVRESKDFFVPLPRGVPIWDGHFRPHYRQILDQQRICDYVNDAENPVREIWIFGYHAGQIEPDESRMSSRYGDISNANPRDETIAERFRMPKCNNSYVMYNFTYQLDYLRELGDGLTFLGNTLHNRLHQLENVIFYAENRGYPADDRPGSNNVIGSLFWDDFSVYGQPGPAYEPSCGNTHRPPNMPNGGREYVYNSPDLRGNNCETWHPDASRTSRVTASCAQWGCVDHGFYKWFLQNAPGYANGIVFNGRYMRNWWEAMYDFNRFIDEGRTLYTDHAVTMSATAATVLENAGSVTLTVDLNTPSGKTVTVGYSTKNGSAVAGGDFVATSNILTFSPGQTRQTIRIPLLADGTAEGAETFSVVLGMPVNAQLGTPSATTVTIDTDYEFTMAVPAQTVGESAGRATIAVRLNVPVPAGQTMTVDFDIAGGSATVNGDYASTGGTFIFTPGMTSLSTSIAILEDGLLEGAETFVVRLRAPVNARIGAHSTTIVTIGPNDAVSMAASTMTVLENAGFATLELSLNAPSAHSVTVSYATRNGSALAGSDFVATNDSVTFRPGQKSQTIRIPLLADGVAEPAETFSVELGAVVNAQSGKPTVTVVTIATDYEFTMATPALTVQENAGQATIAVRLSAPVPAGQTMTVDFDINGGNATVNGDYASTSGTLIFTPGMTNLSSTVAILEDGLLEGAETFLVRLREPVNARIGTPAATTVTIAPNDALAFSASAYIGQEGEPVVLTVQLNAPSSQPVTVRYRTRDASALGTLDYVKAADLITFAPGETSKPVTIQLLADQEIESDEAFWVDLNSATNAQIGNPISVLVTILGEGGGPSSSR